MKYLLMIALAALSVMSCVNSTESPEYQTLEINMLDFCEDKETEKPYFVGPTEYNQLEILASRVGDALEVWTQVPAQFAPGKGIMITCPGPYRGGTLYKIKWN